MDFKFIWKCIIVNIVFSLTWCTHFKGLKTNRGCVRILSSGAHDYGIQTNGKQAFIGRLPENFRLKLGGFLGKNRTFGIESVRLGGFYLRQRNYKFFLEKPSKKTSFAKDATFHVVKLQEKPVLYGLELYQRPSWFMQHNKRLQLTLGHVRKSTNHNRDTAFIIKRIACKHKGLSNVQKKTVVIDDESDDVTDDMFDDHSSDASSTNHEAEKPAKPDGLSIDTLSTIHKDRTVTLPASPNNNSSLKAENKLEKVGKPTKNVAEEDNGNTIIEVIQDPDVKTSPTEKEKDIIKEIKNAFKLQRSNKNQSSLQILQNVIDGKVSKLAQDLQKQKEQLKSSSLKKDNAKELQNDANLKESNQKESFHGLVTKLNQDEGHADPKHNQTMIEKDAKTTESYPSKVIISGKPELYDQHTISAHQDEQAISRPIITGKPESFTPDEVSNDKVSGTPQTNSEEKTNLYPAHPKETKEDSSTSNSNSSHVKAQVLPNIGANELKTNVIKGNLQKETIKVSSHFDKPVDGHNVPSQGNNSTGQNTTKDSATKYPEKTSNEKAQAKTKDQEKEIGKLSEEKKQKPEHNQEESAKNDTTQSDKTEKDNGDIVNGEPKLVNDKYEAIARGIIARFPKSINDTIGKGQMTRLVNILKKKIRDRLNNKRLKLANSSDLPSTSHSFIPLKSDIQKNYSSSSLLASILQNENGSLFQPTIFFSEQCDDAFPKACAEWNTKKLCLTFGELMKRYCKKTCNLCDHVATTGFTECDKTCGGGVRLRMIKVHNKQILQQRACNTFKCPVDGGYTPYSNFTACSATCGNGLQYQQRTCTLPPPQFGGKDCSRLGSPIRTRNCFVDCKDEKHVKGYHRHHNNHRKHHRLAVSQSNSSEDHAKDERLKLQKQGYYEYGYGDIPKTNADHVDMSYESPIDRLADMAASSVGKALDEDSLDLVRSSIIQGNGSESPKRTLTEELNAEKEEAMNEQEYEENIARRSSKNDRPWTTD
ncbi:uncharacterized protein LOC110251394 isoform X2 [Exaiptasia diaphana]|uniref:ShKT domain-containing protein n=1 Tax=Exaiptasia diaphana TaxID=2652724 RepID=A0A913YUF6_EXADI|nr:uncharacterized protein LOC110251394 isoform X2 [Exaiptasia diaphana]